MDFYLNQEKLAAHMDDLSQQRRLVHRLSGQLRSLLSTAEGDQAAVLHRCLVQAEELDRALEKLHQVLEEHNEDMSHFFRQTSRAVDDLNVQIDRVFS